MLEVLDHLLKCLGPCRSVLISESVRWDYSIGTLFPSVEDVSADRLYVQASLISINYRGKIKRGMFRFSIYGGVGSVGVLVADDLRYSIGKCLYCQVQNFDLQSTSIAFPLRNSDRTINVNAISFVILK